MGDDGAVTDSATPDRPAAPAGNPGAAATVAGGRRPPRRRLFAAVLVVVLVLDQLTKIAAIGALEGEPPVPLLGRWLQLTLLRNPGAAFSMGTGATWLFTTIQLGYLAAAVWFSGRLHRAWPAVAVGLIAGGAAGNLVDRLLREPAFYVGHVVDFISVRGFAVFNIADSAITVGVVILAAWLVLAPAEGAADA